jgi:hypothetical protein
MTTIKEMRKRFSSVSKGEKLTGYLVSGKFTIDPDKAVMFVREAFRDKKFPPDTVEIGEVTITLRKKPIVVARGETESLKGKLKKIA